MVAVGPGATGRIWRSALSYRRSAGPCPASSGTGAADHECIPSRVSGPTMRAVNGPRWEAPPAEACPLVQCLPDRRQQRRGHVAAATSAGRVGTGRAGCSAAATVEPRGVQAGGQHHPGGGGRIPFPLPAGVQVASTWPATTAIAFGPGRPDRHRLDRPAPGCMAPHDGRGAGGADRHPHRVGAAARAAGSVTVSVRYTMLPRAGSDTAASVIAPWPSPSRCQSAMCTAQSERPRLENSRVPSNGSMIHTRSAASRAKSSSASSLSTASRGRACCRRCRINALARRSPASPSIHG
ncbi:hypothetical protein C1Y40_01610 [Mycobacterium talmoniae]|uniref:Uncharacterized protein n=1 Tax=Mycobacterium talmoniae TaxID=1858794 RepID=A0A2S8BND3_9MYCO|nr:hypothetical protein C1Y40_01610 [Mycobacterium talmoniae]